MTFLAVAHDVCFSFSDRLYVGVPPAGCCMLWARLHDM
jgi:hypothetical protein